MTDQEALEIVLKVISECTTFEQLKVISKVHNRARPEIEAAINERACQLLDQFTHPEKLETTMEITITNTRYNPLAQRSIDQATNKNGFGSRIPTDQMIQINGSKRWYRLYESFMTQHDSTGKYNYAFIFYKGQKVRWFNGLTKICS